MIVTDLNGTRDTVEFLNIAQDDVMSWPQPTHCTYPATVNARMNDAVIPFIRKSMAVNNTVLDIFERLLGLPRGSLAQLHAMDEACGSEARIVKTPPNQNSAGIGAHTDFGTLVRSSIRQLYCEGTCDLRDMSDIPAQPPRRAPSDAPRYTGMALRQGLYHSQAAAPRS